MTPYTHPDYPAFVKAIRDQPTDAVNKLVAADFIEEHGDPFRARVIREMCAGKPFAASARDIRRWFELAKAESELVAFPNVANATGGVLRYMEPEEAGQTADRDTTDYLILDGGFVTSANVRLVTLIDWFDRIHEREPIASVAVRNWETVNRRPAIFSLGRDDKRRVHIYHTARQYVEIGDIRMAEIRRERVFEKALAEAVFAKRWPGTRFTVDL